MTDKSNHSNAGNQTPIANKDYGTPSTAVLEQITAVGSGWAERADGSFAQPAVSANELISLTALIAYVANVCGTTEFRVERDLADRFNVANVKCLPSVLYDAAIRCLVDQVPVVAA